MNRRAELSGIAHCRCCFCRPGRQRLPGSQLGPGQQLRQQGQGGRRIRTRRSTERRTKFKRFATHTQDKGRGRRLAFGLAIDLEDGFWRQRVAGVRDCGRRENLAKIERGRRAAAGINKYSQSPAVQVKGVLNLQLEILDQLDLTIADFGPFFEFTADDSFLQSPVRQARRFLP